ncbi:hypothetical protein OAG98_02670 [Acidimicrobiales bacterium]|nr:hypothetical protein [Acidimicrobiales bacterium]
MIAIILSACGGNDEAAIEASVSATVEAIATSSPEPTPTAEAPTPVPEPEPEPTPAPLFDGYKDVFTPWAESFYGQQRVDAMNEEVDAFWSVAGARTSDGGYAGQAIYESKIRMSGQEAADAWWDMRRYMFDLNEEKRDEARQMGMELPDPLSQARMNLQMADVLGVTVDELKGMSIEDAQALFEQEYPKYEQRQALVGYILESSDDG